MDNFVDFAPSPQPRAAEIKEAETRQATTRKVVATEPKFSGFVFKIQANMDPSHHDRVAFLRITSGQF